MRITNTGDHNVDNAVWLGVTNSNSTESMCIDAINTIIESLITLEA